MAKSRAYKAGSMKYPVINGRAVILKNNRLVSVSEGNWVSLIFKKIFGNLHFFLDK